MNLRTISFGALMLAMVSMFSSCNTVNEKEPDGPQASDVVFLDAAAQNVTEATLDFPGDWQIIKTGDNFTVSPLSGFAGSNKLTFTTTKANESFAEVESTIVVNVGTEHIRYYVFQRPALGASCSPKTATFAGKGGELDLIVKASAPFEYSKGEGSDWFEVKSVAKIDSTLLADGKTYSQTKTYRVSISATENTGDYRESTISLKTTDGQSLAEIPVQQIGNVDYAKTFYRRSLGVRFTATWCGYCPMMAEAFKIAMKEEEGRIVNLNIYGAQSQDLTYRFVNEMQNYYKVEGYPTGAMNDVAQVANYSSATTANIIKGLANEAKNNLPANSQLACVSSLDGNKVNLELFIATKEAKQCKLHVFLVENDIVQSQTNGGANYVHNYVARTAMTAAHMGDDYSFEANSIKYVPLSVDVPSAVRDQNNLAIIAYVTYEGNYHGSVANADYMDFGNIVDNVIYCPVGSLVDYKYE
ncbi:MAG: Omp28-related outer membrane protein [Bacteroidales bacterium]|nr:Omp28-related outer membrane protein [Bacteroidales bacterium]